MKKKSLFSKETIFTKRHVLKHCPCNQIILCLYENWYYNYVLNYYFKVRNYIKKKLWLALNHRTSLTVEAMTMNFQLILLEKKKMVKMLNINIFHEKATGKGEKKKITGNIPITSTASQGIALFTTQVHIVHFQPDMHLFSRKCTTALMYYKKNFSRGESCHVFTLVLFPYFFMVVESLPPFESSLISHFLQHIGNSPIQLV